MRRYIDGSGQPQLWLDETEIESTMALTVKRAGMSPTADEPVVDVERLLEVGMQVVLDQYAPLDADLLGVTTFRRGQPPEVQINADLTGAFDTIDTPNRDRARWRSTLAHETAHVVLHAQLFQLDEHQGELFAPMSVSLPELQRCLKRAVGFDVRGSDPREVQANMGMASLLMPKPVFTQLATEATEHLGLHRGELIPGTSGARRLVAVVADRFEVSRQATEIRLDGLRFFAKPGERRLPEC